MALEGAGHRELAELVPDHVLVDEHRHVLATVVDGDGQADHFRQDHRATRPGLDRALVVGGNRSFHLLDKVKVDERTFLQRTRHVGFLLLATTHDELLRALVVAGLVALGRRAPRADRMTTTRSLALTTAVRMVDRVHDHAADGRTNALPTLGAGLAQLLEAVLGVADFADGGAAVDRHAAHLAGTQTQRGVAGLASHQLHRGAGAAGDLRTLACLHLDAVHGRANRDVAQRQAVAGLDRRIGAGHQTVTHRPALRRDDVAALAIGVAQQRDVRGAVGIVLDALDDARDAFLVALEVDDAVMLLVPAAAMTRGGATVMVATTRLRLRLGQRRVGSALVQTFGADADCVATPGRGRLVRN